MEKQRIKTKRHSHQQPWLGRICCILRAVYKQDITILMIGTLHSKHKQESKQITCNGKSSEDLLEYHSDILCIGRVCIHAFGDDFWHKLG